MNTNKFMASELVAELQAMIESQGDQPVQVSVNSKRHLAYITNNKDAGDYPVSGCYQHFRINVNLGEDLKIIHQKAK